MPDDDDCLLMHTQPPFRWVTDDEQVMSILLDDDMDNTVYHHYHHHHQYDPYSMHNHLPAPLTRNMRHDLKKTKIPEQLVYHYESQIIAYLDEQDVDLVMVLDIADRFTRWVVHIMCSYYNLVSFSKYCARVLLYTAFIIILTCKNAILPADHDHLDHQGQLLYIQQHTSDPHVVPDRLFSDFLFCR